MSDIIRALFLFLILAIAPGMVPSSRAVESSAGPASKVTQLQKKYQQLRSLELDFSQSTLTGGRMKQGNGNAIFYRSAVRNSGSSPTANGIMRWNYIAPTVQTIINDGKELSIYTPQDKQLIVSPTQDMESDITYAIFTGTKNLLDEFAIAPPDKLFVLNDPPAGYDAILLTPKKPHPQVKRIQLWLSGDLTIHRLLMEDHFNALTELTFTKVRFNTLPPGDTQKLQSLLKLDLAPGTETIRQ
jgi:outer membrane lipoprotein carrier protein